MLMLVFVVSIWHESHRLNSQHSSSPWRTYPIFDASFSWPSFRDRIFMQVFEKAMIQDVRHHLNAVFAWPSRGRGICQACRNSSKSETGGVIIALHQESSSRRKKVGQSPQPCTLSAGISWAMLLAVRGQLLPQCIYILFNPVTFFVISRPKAVAHGQAWAEGIVHIRAREARLCVKILFVQSRWA